MSWYDAMKDAARVFGKIKDAEATEALANLKIEGAELAQQNAQLREENRTLIDQLRVRETLEFEDPVYWIVESGGKRTGPFCSRCWDVDQKLVRVHDERWYWQCPACHENPNKKDRGGNP